MDSLPPTPTSVYLYYDRHDILLYVGITSRGIKRNREHNETKDWWQFVGRQEVEHYDGRPLALARERSLIEKHHPPFNTQHNRDHAKVREAYLLFMAAQSQASTVLDDLRALNKQIPLERHSDPSAARLVLRTRIEHGLLGAAIRMPEDAHPKVYGLPRKTKSQGRIVEIDRAGPLALLHISRKVEHPIKHATLSVKYDTKLGLLWATGVQIVLDHSDSTQCSPYCPRPTIRWVRPDGQGAA